MIKSLRKNSDSRARFNVSIPIPQGESARSMRRTIREYLDGSTPEQVLRSVYEDAAFARTLSARASGQA